MRHEMPFRRHATVSRRHPSAGERVERFLRGLYPEKTAANVSADTRGRIPAKTIEKMLERQSAGALSTSVILLEVYGPEFMCALMGPSAPDWLTEAGRSAANARIDAKIAELEALRKEIA